jgi:hypothetical protein
MAKWQLKNIRSLNIAAHRDFGYFFSTLIIIYCLSGLALNHVDDWNPDFIITRDSVSLSGGLRKDQITPEQINAFSKQIGEEEYKVFDFPTPNQVKVYYEDASLHLNFETGRGVYENVSRRAVFYESNVIHRNSVKGWKWAADVFAIMLIVINVTGLFILRGKYGISGRGKWLIAAGMLPPVIAIIILHYVQ